MKKRPFLLSTIKTIFCVSTILILLSCGNNPSDEYSIITEVYEVQEADNQFAAGKLKYMEVEDYKNDLIMSKTFYNADQSVRGKEVYHYDDKKKYPSHSKYYGPNDALLSTYQFEYVDTLRSKAMAYEGDSDELLRIETFKYDEKGQMVKKTILTDQEIKDKSFLFGHDQYGNQITMSVLDKDDNPLVIESYEIKSYDDKGRWTEKYGYKNNEVKPRTYYKCMRSR